MAKKPKVEPTQELDGKVTDENVTKGRLTPEDMDLVEGSDSDLDTSSQTDVGVIASEKPQKKSSKLLPAAVLLLAGGGAALYGGPKLAPHLPAGMAPVAEFLSPGEATARDQIANLEKQLATRIEALENAEAPDISAELASLNSGIEERITGLSDQIAATDSGDIEARLAAVETQLSGLSASMETLTNKMAGVSSGEASPELASYQSVIDGLRAEIAALSSKQGMIGQRIDEVAVKTDRRVEEADAKVEEVTQTAQASISDITQAKAISDIAAAIESGTGFADALTTLSDGGVTISAALMDAGAGVATLAKLKADFSSAAHGALKASIKSEADTGTTSKLMGFLKSQVTVRSLEPQDGETTDAVLSRIQGALDADNLSDALMQAAGLNEVSKSAMSDWLASATKRQSALDAVSALSGN